MALTTAQLATIKADVLADPVLSTLAASSDSANKIITAMLAPVTPEFIVWRSNVPAGEIGNAWNGADIDGMSSLNMQRLQLLLASSPSGVFDMSRADRRTGFLNPFGASPSNPSRVAMTAVFKRAAKRIEKLFATGTGTDASPATMGYEGGISYYEVLIMMGW